MFFEIKPLKSKYWTHYRLYIEKFQLKPGILLNLYLDCTKTSAFYFKFPTCPYVCGEKKTSDTL